MQPSQADTWKPPSVAVAGPLGEAPRKGSSWSGPQFQQAGGGRAPQAEGTAPGKAGVVGRRTLSWGEGHRAAWRAHCGKVPHTEGLEQRDGFVNSKHTHHRS